MRLVIHSVAVTLTLMCKTKTKREEPATGTSRYFGPPINRSPPPPFSCHCPRIHSKPQLLLLHPRYKGTVNEYYFFPSHLLFLRIIFSFPLDFFGPSSPSGSNNDKSKAASMRLPVRSPYTSIVWRRRPGDAWVLL